MRILDDLRRVRADFHRDWRGATRTLIRGWVTISVVASLTGTVFDVGIMVLLVQLAHFGPVAAAPCALAVGISVNFAINKIFSFKDSVGHTGLQFLRFAVGAALAGALHAGVVWVFTTKLGLHYVLSKLMADIVVFSGGNLVILRYFAFPKNVPDAAESDGVAS